jgi:hypothetical protein
MVLIRHSRLPLQRVRQLVSPMVKTPNELNFFMALLYTEPQAPVFFDSSLR